MPVFGVGCVSHLGFYLSAFSVPMALFCSISLCSHTTKLGFHCCWEPFILISACIKSKAVSPLCNVLHLYYLPLLVAETSSMTPAMWLENVCARRRVRLFKYSHSSHGKILGWLFSHGTESCLVQKLIHKLLVWIGCDLRGTLLLYFQMEIPLMIFLTEGCISGLSWVLNCSFSLPDSRKCHFFLNSSSVPDLNMTQLHFRNLKQHFWGVFGLFVIVVCCFLF